MQSDQSSSPNHGRPRSGLQNSRPPPGEPSALPGSQIETGAAEPRRFHSESIHVYYPRPLPLARKLPVRNEPPRSPFHQGYSKVRVAKRTHARPTELETEPRRKPTPAPGPAPTPARAVAAPAPGSNARQLIRQPPPIANPPPKRAQSHFNYIAPLRTHSLPMKELPQRSSFLVVHEEREKSRRKEKAADVPGVRSMPRSSMSVPQRRAGQSPRKTSRNTQRPADRPVGMTVIPMAAVYVGPGGKVVVAGEGNKDKGEEGNKDGETEEEKDRTQRRFPQGQIGRKTGGPLEIVSQAARKTEVREIVRAAKKLKISVSAARKTRVGFASDDDNVMEISSDEENAKELLQAFDVLTNKERLLQQYHRVPFLRRNLRSGFEGRCMRNGIRIAPEEPPNGKAKIIYHYYLHDSESEVSDSGDFDSVSSDEDERECQKLVEFMTQWICPLCELHDPFRTKEMLAFHLRDYHVDVKVSWIRNVLGKRWEHRWIIKIVIPHIKKVKHLEVLSEEESEHEERQEDDEGSPAPSEPRQFVRDEPLFLPGSPFQPASSASPPASATPPILLEAEVEEVKPRLRPNLQTATTRRSYRGTLDTRYPSPPPSSDPLGPAAQYPYLPETDADGSPLYSCRIGGPRIFDLLNTLPIEDFGVMSWEIIEQEEELFEMEDGLLDEDKVMLALWNRWIMVNRTSFVFDRYLIGLERFIDDYWTTIHQAAGWRALRAFLLMMKMHRYISSFPQLLSLLQRYEQKTGMDQWYKE